MKKSDPDSGLTTEHIKSHLQKYRINYERSRQEFQELCDREIKRNRKRRRLQEQSVGSSYVFLIQPRESPARHATDSDSGPGADDSSCSTSSANTPMYEDGQRLRPFVCSRELADAASAISAIRYPVNYSTAHQASMEAPVLSSVPEFTNAQWRTFSTLMAEPTPFRRKIDSLSIRIPQDTPTSLMAQAQEQDELQVQMHLAMQAQMNCHRQMLTREVELSHDLFRGSRAENLIDSRHLNSNYSLDAQHKDFEHARMNIQQNRQHQLVHHRLDQHLSQSEVTSIPLLQSTPTPPMASQSMSNDALPSLIATESIEAKSDAVGDDLNRWDPFNVDLESDDLFDFLKA
ncbi:unnamed protein product [Phytophthora lilii]|uniref:Unnamed protein product n=1 Tax=Phytophthora lilii TaxID=2077276 RepID=A0A9W6TJT5_9STRA|nr:unnamed protein product [Phytophthora lilii]